jgi:glycerophosphoryl diester phosphodiesterase
MKKSFGIIATLALALSPVAAFATDAQTNIQRASNSAAAVGVGNYVNQNINQENFQDQYGLDGYLNPQGQTSVQDAANSGAAIGQYNTVDQNVDQYNQQGQVDVNGYLTPPVGY